MVKSRPYEKTLTELFSDNEELEKENTRSRFVSIAKKQRRRFPNPKIAIGVAKSHQLFLYKMLGDLYKHKKQLEAAASSCDDYDVDSNVNISKVVALETVIIRLFNNETQTIQRYQNLSSQAQQIMQYITNSKLDLKTTESIKDYGMTVPEDDAPCE